MRTLLSATLALTLTAGSASAGTFTDLEAPDAKLTGLSINGRIASLYTVDSGWRWAKDVGVVPVGNFVESRGLNSWGQPLAGSSFDGDGNEVGALAYSNSDLVGGPRVIDQWPGAVPQDGFLSAVFDVSDDGTAVGLALDENSKYFAFRWNAASGMTKLPVNRPQRSSRANRISADGSTVVGWNDQENGFRSGVIWKNGVAIDLVDADGNSVGEATAVSRDGRVVVGERYFDLDSVPFRQVAWRWTEETGVQPIGCFANSFGTCGPTSARAVSDDGNLVIGDDTGTGSYVATAWTPDDGMQSLADYFAAHGVDVPDGWILQSGNGISADGKTIGGWGVSPVSGVTSFVADLHENEATEALVVAHGTVFYNDLPDGPFAGAAEGTKVTMTFRITQDDATEIDPGHHTLYPIELDTFHLTAGDAGDTLVSTAAGPGLRLTNDYPLSDGIHLFETPTATTGQSLEFELFNPGGDLFDSDDLNRINRTFTAANFEKTAWSVTQGGEFGMYIQLDDVSIDDFVPGEPDDVIFHDGFDG